MTLVEQVFQPLSRVRSSEQRFYPAWRGRLQNGPGVVRQGPQVWVELGPELVAAAVPRPPQIEGEIRQRLQPDRVIRGHRSHTISYETTGPCLSASGTAAKA